MSESAPVTMESLHGDFVGLKERLDRGQTVFWAVVCSFGLALAGGAWWVASTTVRLEERSVYATERIEEHARQHGHQPLRREVQDTQRQVDVLEATYQENQAAVRRSIEAIEATLREMNSRRRRR